MWNAFVLYMPIKELDGSRSGGVVSIKIGPSTSAHLAFASETLAKEFCERRHVGKDARILESGKLGADFPVLSKKRSAMCFPDRKTLDAYFADPDAFPYEQHLVSLETGQALDGSEQE